MSGANPFAGVLDEVLKEYQAQDPSIKSLDDLPHMETDILQNLHDKQFKSPWFPFLSMVFTDEVLTMLFSDVPNANVKQEVEEMKGLMAKFNSEALPPDQRAINFKAFLARMNTVLGEVKKAAPTDLSGPRALVVVDPQNDFTVAKKGSLGCKKTKDDFLQEAQEEFVRGVKDDNVKEVVVSFDTHGLESMWNSKAEMNRVLGLLKRFVELDSNGDFILPISKDVYMKVLDEIDAVNRHNKDKEPIGDISMQQLQGLAEMYNVKIEKGPYVGQRLFDKFPVTSKLGLMSSDKDELKKIMGTDDDHEVEHMIERAGIVWWGNHCTPGTPGWEPYLKWPDANGQPIVKLQLDRDPESKTFGELKVVINPDYLKYLQDNGKSFSLIFKGSPESSHGDCLCHKHGLAVSHAYGPFKNAPHSKAGNEYNRAYKIEPTDTVPSDLTLGNVIAGNISAKDVIKAKVVEVQGLASSHCIHHALKELKQLGKTCIHNLKSSRPVGGVGDGYLDFNDLVTAFVQKIIGVKSVASNDELLKQDIHKRARRG